MSSLDGTLGSLREDVGSTDDVVAGEDVRVKGRVYRRGQLIPVRLWEPRFLSVALRVGTVRRTSPGPDPDPDAGGTLNEP